MKVSRFTVLKTALIVCGMVIGLSVFVHPAGQLRAVAGAPQLILQGSEASPEVLAIIERSCQNCHSAKTEWPWYSYVAPMSWMIENDVSTGRRHMNLTNWQTYTSVEKIQILSHIAPLVRNHVMPPKKYLALHPQAKLSTTDIAQIQNWAHQERRNLRDSSRK